MASRKSSRPLRTLRCPAVRVTGPAQAVLTLHHATSAAGRGSLAGECAADAEYPLAARF